MARVRFIHAADVHLGAPLSSMGAASASMRERLAQASFRALERLVSAALDHQVDCLLIAGDLYDREARSIRASEYLATQFARLAEANTPVYIIHGNHDPLGDQRQPIAMPENVHVFGHETVGARPLLRGGEPVAWVLGQSYRRRFESRKMYRDYRRQEEGLPHIGLLHTGLDPDSNRYVPCSLGNLRDHPHVDYWALGHIHQCRVLADGHPYIAYPGTPQGRHIGEPGLGGCLLVELEPEQAPQVSFIPTADIVWLEREVPVGGGPGEPGPANLDELHVRLSAVAEELAATAPGELAAGLPVPLAAAEPSPGGFAVRWRVCGRGPVHDVIAGDDEAADVLQARLRRDLSEGSPFVWSEAVRLQTAAPLPELTELAAGDPVFSQLLRLLEQVEQDEPLRQQLAAQAGEIWERSGEPEDMPDDSLYLSDERLQSLLARAGDLIVDRLMAQREGGGD